MSNGRSWHIIRARKSSFAFQATDLFDVLACEAAWTRVLAPYESAFQR